MLGNLLLVAAYLPALFLLFILLIGWEVMNWAWKLQGFALIGAALFVALSLTLGWV